MSGTALSQGYHCPGQHWVKVITVRDSAESSWSLSGIALRVSKADHCPGLRWVKLIIVLDSSESSWSISWTVLSHAERWLGQAELLSDLVGHVCPIFYWSLIHWQSICSVIFLLDNSLTVGLILFLFLYRRWAIHSSTFFCKILNFSI